MPVASPPPGPPWDLPLAEAPLAFVDLEMTGLDSKTDRVIEVCIERVRGDVVQARIHTLVRPEGGEIGNVHVHGISVEALADAPSFASIADDVAKILEGAIFVAHGAKWDVEFIVREMERAGRTAFAIPHYIDTLNLSRRTFGLSSHSLEALRKHFGLDASRAHRADADVEALRAVFARCIAELEPGTPRDLWEVRVAERRAREAIVAHCREALQSHTPVTLVYRPRGKPAEQVHMMITSIDDTHDPPRLVGYMLPGRGRRELRTDRILRIEP